MRQSNKKDSVILSLNMAWNGKMCVVFGDLYKFCYFCREIVYAVLETSRCGGNHMEFNHLYYYFRKFVNIIFPNIMKRFSLSSIFLLVGFYCCAQTAFEKRISDLGFSEIVTDWSDSAEINIPKPKCAYVNVTGINNLPQNSKILKGWMEVYDGNGNYFKKRIMTTIQGKSTTTWPKKNFKVDFCEDEWIGDATTTFTIGDWVDQESYHFKAFYLDYFRGVGIVGYSAYQALSRDRGEYGWIWERAADYIKKPDLRARCYPDGFPCVVYLNGEFNGIYCWQLKKHRKNMNQKKNTLEHIHLDGSLANKTLFRGVVKWGSVEVRNPKNLYDMSGNPYDSDKRTELIDETSPYFDIETDDEQTKERKQNTAKVKSMIARLSRYAAELAEMQNNGASLSEMRAAIEERFDVPSLIDYIIHNLLTNNMDGCERNFQCFTYDGIKWFIAPYDLDGTFGYHCTIPMISLPTNYVMGSLGSKSFASQDPMSWAYNYFKQDMYAEIRNKGLLSAENISSLFDNWYYSFGEDNYRMEYEKWPQSPPNLEDIPNDGWVQDLPYSYAKYSKAPDYSPDVEYHEGDQCRATCRVWKATKTVKGVYPYKQVGTKDSLERIYSWVKIHVETLDAYMKYKFESTIRSYTLEVSNAGWATVCVPFQFSVPEGMKLYAVTGRDEDGRLEVTEVASPEANKPYLVEALPGSYFLTGYTEEADEYADDYLRNGLLQGCYAEKYIPQGNYVLQNHNGTTGFYKVSKDGLMKISPNRAYLRVDSEDLEADEFTLDGGDVTIARQMNAEDSQIVGIFDMGGQRQDKLRKGLNLVRYSDGTTIKMMKR